MGQTIETHTSPSTRIVTHASLLLTAMLWGGNFAAIRFLLEELEPLDVVFVRGVGAALFFGVVLVATGRPWLGLSRRQVGRLAVIGVLGVTIVNVAVTFGQQRLPASLASLIVTSNPIFVALISRLALGERLGARKLGGIGLAFVGLAVVLLGGPGGADGAGTVGMRELGGAAILIMAPLSWAVYTVLSKPVLKLYPSVHVAAYTTILGAAWFLPLPLARDGMLGRIGSMGARSWGAALFVTLVSFVVAYILWYRGLRVLTASEATVYIYLVPVFGLLAAWLVLGERPGPWLLLGGATIISGVALTNSAPGRPAAAKRAVA